MTLTLRLTAAILLLYGCAVLAGVLLFHGLNMLRHGGPLLSPRVFAVVLGFAFAAFFPVVLVAMGLVAWKGEQIRASFPAWAIGSATLFNLCVMLALAATPFAASSALGWQRFAILLSTIGGSLVFISLGGLWMRQFDASFTFPQR